ncbi:heat-shock protein Hsp70 [Elizabethkingia anophelis]|uniref:Hsp70 family protein n=1 Tax=Chryseobacterium salviniae TaxID=3101750 RepID=A0ABU6HMX3_9FLAO|nr:Hsp70 family protein [Chryseobacterium sp. T9W2-O]MDV3554893.1 heat-shock protein Hsp70 [Elizabethkingia anophelis]MEC3874278.1 Hsp70 family protein [Chryseobacterium sp. T9W2-O]
MARTKIDYGIDLGTTNSAISRIESGEAKIIKVNGLDDTMPSCIAYNKKGVLAGKKAFAVYRSEQEASLSKDIEPNAFIEFKRTMGTDRKYFSSNLDKDLSSEELSAEVLKTLKSFVTDEAVNAVVITVPAAFKNNQIDATRRAAKLAGFEHAEVLQEPVAAAMAYGLDNKNKDGFWLVFDFGGGTFDAALLKVEDGIMKVADTEGDNYLGGKNLDLAVVDEIIIPHIQENFSINGILNDDHKKAKYREALKPFAEELKNELSFKNEFNLYKEEGAGTDDDGEDIEIDLTITQADLENVLSPVFQKAVDISKKLLERNNLKGSSLDSLILVGGPTFSPIIRKMLEKQICKPDTTVDPMTVVSKGAALYASTVSISEEIKEQTRDKSKIQIEIGHEASTVELEEFVTLKILIDKTEGTIPEKVFAEITRSDKAWSSGKVEINEIGEVIETQLIEGKTNGFEVTLFDDKGNLLESEPKEFTIIQGIGGLNSMQGLTLNWGIEIKKRETGKIEFRQVSGLEQNKSLPATGTANGLKTQKQIRPGMDSDFIKIPLYQGEHGADGTRAIYNEHVYDIIISGADLPALLPDNSDVDLTISIDKSQKVSIQAYFPYLDHTSEIEVPTDTVQSVETSWLSNEIRKAKGSIEELKDEGISDDKVQKAETEIAELERKFENSKNDVDGKQEVLTNLRKTLKTIDELSETTEWPKLEEELKEEFYRLEKANKDLGNDRSTQVVNQLRNQLEEVLKSQDIKLGKALAEEIHSVFFQMTLVYQLINFIRQHNQHFASYHWKDSNRARQLLNEGLQQIGENPNTDDLHPIVVDLINLLPNEERPSGDDSVLVG